MLSEPLLNPLNYKEIKLKLMQWFAQRHLCAQCHTFWGKKENLNKRTQALAP